MTSSVFAQGLTRPLAEKTSAPTKHGCSSCLDTLGRGVSVLRPAQPSAPASKKKKNARPCVLFRRAVLISAVCRLYDSNPTQVRSKRASLDAAARDRQTRHGEEPRWWVTYPRAVPRRPRLDLHPESDCRSWQNLLRQARAETRSMRGNKTPRRHGPQELPGYFNVEPVPWAVWTRVPRPTRRRLREGPCALRRRRPRSSAAVELGDEVSQQKRAGRVRFGEQFVMR